MSRDKESLPISLLPVVDRLREERPAPDGLELDRIKLRALSAAPAAESGRTPRMAGGAFLRTRRVASVVAAVALMSGGTAVFAASGGFQSAASSPSGSSARSQYCPPPAQGPPKPKNGANKCGQPKTKP